ncbi:MAG TPA: hypothetical protein RMH99_20620, partial [Sandaracinaceae bacterium LLY-WYZ-13_1]|nr:hypothetical protein [Sandaracinaceae bacterium LLY-WYZ-13_1]
MRTWTLVTEALGPGGRRHASSLAARGKDLVLLGPPGALLEELAAELRVVHDVDVRVIGVDLAEPGAAERVVAWIEGRDVTLGGMVSVEPDPRDGAVRQLGVKAELARLEDRLRASIRHRGLGAIRRVAAHEPGVRRARRSVVPPGAAPSDP